MRENRSEPFVLPDAAIEGANQPPDERPVDPGWRSGRSAAGRALSMLFACICGFNEPNGICNATFIGGPIARKERYVATRSGQT
jgi:hypothetical protein